MSSFLQELQAKYQVQLLTSELPPQLEAVEVLGMVQGSAVVGANFIRDFFARVADVTGGRVKGYENALEGAVNIALEKLAHQARALGGNAVTRVSVQVSAVGQSMMMAVAYGTVVVAAEGTGAGAPNPGDQAPPQYQYAQNLG